MPCTVSWALDDSLWKETITSISFIHDPWLPEEWLDRCSWSAMELALSLEKLVNEKLLNLHGVKRLAPHWSLLIWKWVVPPSALLLTSSSIHWAGGNAAQRRSSGRLCWERVLGRAGGESPPCSSHPPPSPCSWISDKKSIPHAQVEAIKKISEYVTQLRMVGKGHGKRSSSTLGTELVWSTGFDFFCLYFLFCFQGSGTLTRCSCARAVLYERGQGRPCFASVEPLRVFLDVFTARWL